MWEEKQAKDENENDDDNDIIKNTINQSILIGNVAHIIAVVSIMMLLEGGNYLLLFN